MMKHEFEKLVDCPVSDKHWELVNLVYNHSPLFDGGYPKYKVAKMFRNEGIGPFRLEYQNNQIFREFDRVVRNGDEDQFSTFEVTFGGYIVHTQPKKISQVAAWIQAELQKKGIDLTEYDYFSWDNPGDPWPIDAWRVACFAVTGGSEGHYIHITALHRGEVKSLAVGKTFMGFEHAHKLSNALAELLS